MPDSLLPSVTSSNISGPVKCRAWLRALITDKKPMIDPYGYHWSPTYWAMGCDWVYLQEYGWRVSYRSRKDSKTAAASNHTQCVWDNVQRLGIWKHCTACKQLKWWRVSLASDSVGLNFFPATWLLSVSSKQLLERLSLLWRFTCLRSTLCLFWWGGL